MPTTYVTLVILGLSAIDPIGIFAMFILLAQKQPFRRSFIFLGGSFISLMILGLAFAQSLGRIVLSFEKSNSWIVPGIEAIAGLILLVVACVLLWRIKSGKTTNELSKSILNKLSLGDWQLFFLGALIVAALSALDVVFIIAMVHVGQLHLAPTTLILAVMTYAIAALVLQIIIVAVYGLTPEKQRSKVLVQIHRFSSNYANKALAGASLLIGCILIALAI